MPTRSEIRFLLNDKEVRLSDFSPSLTLLDYLRLERGLCGTKESCNEGDCGACTILVGKLYQGKLIYESINACIRFIGSLDLCHIVTIEYLKSASGKLHAVQQAIVDYHGSQCGFCTPGIIMSLYALLLQKPNANKQDIEMALQGNLCRCTGYVPIINAALSISKKGGLVSDILLEQQKEIAQKLSNMSDGSRVEIINAMGEFIIPKGIDDLVLLLEQKPKATLLAGSSDIGLWVNKHFKNISPVIFIANIATLKQIERGEDNLIIGAAVTYSEAQEIIVNHYPQLKGFWTQIGGNQIRNMGTIGGNIANGSPIGDMAPPLIALGAVLNLRKGKTIRKILVEDFYIAYNKQDLRQGEFIQSIEIPPIKANEIFEVHKVSKRKEEDISTVCAAFKIEIKGNLITQIVLAYGGMAAKPTRAKRAEKLLLDNELNEEIIEKSVQALLQDFTPINDVRATAQYRMLVAQNLLRKFLVEQSS